MKTELVPEGVGALIVCQEIPNLFLGIKHANAKEVSQKLTIQVSMPTETINQGENDSETLDRLWEEELTIKGLNNPGIKLNTCILETTRTRAVLRNYLFFAPLGAEICLIDGEVVDVGWCTFEKVLQAPKGSCHFRASLFETIQCFQKWRNEPNGYKPETFAQSMHNIPTEVFILMENGFSEEESLSRLGLYSAHAPNFLVHNH